MSPAIGADVGARRPALLGPLVADGRVLFCVGEQATLALASSFRLASFLPLLLLLTCSCSKTCDRLVQLLDLLPLRPCRLGPPWLLLLMPGRACLAALAMAQDTCHGR